MKQRRLLWPAAGLIFLGCMSDRNSGCMVKTSGILDGLGGGCPPGPTIGSTHGIRPDGRVDVTAAEAWPDRPPVTTTATATEVAEACAAFAACVDAPTQDGGVGVLGADWRIVALDTCLAGAPRLPTGEFFGINTAERAILIDGSNESWAFFIQSVLAAQGDCRAVQAVLTKRTTSTGCQEDGCYSTSDTLPTVTCQGDVATLESSGVRTTRDCSRAGQHCSSESPTGCTDRPLVACQTSARDRCDGDVKLGCDGCGRVSFHDCSWNGGACVETTDGNAHCEDPSGAGTCVAASTCDGSKISVCVSGAPAQVDCATLGLDCHEGGSGATSNGADAGSRCSALGVCPEALCIQRIPTGVDGGSRAP